MRITVHYGSSKFTYVIQQKETNTIRDIKATLKKIYKIKIDDQILSLDGKVLDDCQTIKESQISEESILCLRINRTVKKKSKSKNNYYFENFTKNVVEMIPKGYKGIDDLQKAYERQKYNNKSRELCSWSSKIDQGVKKTGIKKSLGNLGGIYSVTVSPDCKYIIASFSGKSVKVFDFETKALVHHFQNAADADKIESVAVSSNSRHLICCSKGVKIFDLQTKAEIYSFQKANANEIESVVVSPDSKYIFCHSTNTIKVFDLQTKAEVHQFREDNQNLFSSITVSADSKYIISASSDRSIKAFDLEIKAKVLHIPEAHKDRINLIALSPDGNSIISCSVDKSIKIFDFQAKAEVHHFQQAHKDKIDYLIVSPNNKYIISCSGDLSIKVFDLFTKAELHHFQKVHKGRINSVTFSPDSRYLISVSDDGCMKLFDLQTRPESYSIGTSGGGVTSLAVSFDSRYLICALTDRFIKVFDLDTKAEVHRFQDKNSMGIISVAISPDNKYIVSNSTLTTTVFDFYKKALFHRFERAQEDLFISLNSRHPLAISRDSKYIITSTQSGSIKIFDIQEKVEVHDFQKAHTAFIAALAISLDSKYIVSGSWDRSIKLFDLETRTQVYHFQEVHRDDISSVIVSSDGKYIASGSQDKSIKVFDIQTKALLYHFQEAHKGGVTCLATSPDSNFIISASSDESIKVFDLRTKAETQYYYKKRLFLKGDINSLAVSPDGKYILFNSDGPIRMFPFMFWSSNELLFRSSNILWPSPFSNYDEILLSNPSDQSLWISYQDLQILPHNWNPLHILAIFKPSGFSKIQTYSDMKVSFLVDRYNKTPLHYLLAHDKIDYTSSNIILKYTVDYLQDTARRTPFEHQLICQSLSNILPIIIAKFRPNYVEQYLKLCFIQPSPRFGEVIPTFGDNKKSAVFSNSYVLLPAIKEKLFQEGDHQILFRTVMFYLDYDLRSHELLNFISHLCYIVEEKVFKSPAIAYFINYLWRRTYPLIMISALLFSLLMTLVSIYIGLGQRIIPLESIVLLLILLFLFNEILQMKASGKNYFESIWNWLDLITLILMFFIPFTESTTKNWISSCVLIIGYMRWISYLRLFTPTRNLIQVIVAILKDMLGFILILGIITIGFSLVFLDFNRDEEYSAHFYHTYKILYGTLDDDEYNISQKLFASLIMFLFNVVLLNLLISIMGDSYDKTQNKKLITDSITRLTMIQEILIFIRIFGRNRKPQKGFLMICGPSTLDEEEEENPLQVEWDGKINVIKKLLRQNEQKVIHDMKEIQQENKDRIERHINQELDKVHVNLDLQKINVAQSTKEIRSEINEIKEWVTQSIQNENKKMRDEMRRLIRNSNTHVENMVDKIAEKLIQELADVKKSK